MPCKPITLKPILIWYSNLRLGLPSGLSPSSCPTKILCAPLLYPYVPHAQPISCFWIWVRTILDDEYRSLRALCILLHCPITLLHLGSNIFLNILLSNIIILHFSLSVKGLVCKVIVLFISYLYFLVENWKRKGSKPNGRGLGWRSG